MQKIIIANIHRIGTTHLISDVDKHLDDGWRVASVTPILGESDGGSYTRQIMFVLETDYFEHVLSDEDDKR